MTVAAVCALANGSERPLFPTVVQARSDPVIQIKAPRMVAPRYTVTRSIANGRAHFPA